MSPTSGKRVTQTDIANRLGLSQEAVSHALRGTGTLSEATRALVKHTARDMGYRPNTLARSMQRGRFDSVGFLASTGLHATPLNFQFMRGLYEVLHEAAINLVFARMPDAEFRDRKRPPRMLTEFMVDAMILNLTQDLAEEALELIEQAQVPAVFINEQLEHNCVYPDEIQGGRMAAEALAENGHRRVTFFASLPLSAHHHFSMSERLEGFRKEWTRRGHEMEAVFPDEPMRGGTFGDWLDALLRRTFLEAGETDRVTGWVSGSRDDTVALLMACHRLGLVPGSDLSMIYIDFDANPIGGIQPACIRTPFYWLGREAGRMAAQLSRGPDAHAPAVKVAYRDVLPGDTLGPR